MAMDGLVAWGLVWHACDDTGSGLGRARVKNGFGEMGILGLCMCV